VRLEEMGVSGNRSAFGEKQRPRELRGGTGLLAPSRDSTSFFRPPPRPTQTLLTLRTGSARESTKAHGRGEDLP
jgi:hypothetical protein